MVVKAGGHAIPLKVAGAFHSALMEPAARGLAEKLDRTPFESPSVPVIANVNCQFYPDAVSIRQCLAEQLTHPVLWQASMERLLEEGVERFVEIGPGRILTGMMKKISRKTPVVSISSAEGLSQVAAPVG